jgi:hypothetical protein
MPSPNATPTPITPPRVPLIDPRTGLIDRAWYLFFLSLLNAATIVDEGNLGTDTVSLIASYDAALQALAQNVETQPPPVDLSAELAKQIQEAGLTDQSSALLSQIAEMQKQLEALSLLPPPTQGTVTAVTATAPVLSSGGIAPDISLAAGYGDTQNPYAAKTANFVLAGPTAGAAAVPTFRALVVADIPALPYGTGTVTSVSVVSANGFAGTVANPTTTPAITLTTSISGILYGNGTAVAATTISAPLAYSAGTLSITQASGSTNGFLSSTDWTTFNNKGSGTVTSVAALTLGTTGTDLSSTVANSTTTPVITLNVPTASATNRGALSSADWSTFNSKQPVSAPVTKTADFTVAATEVWLINNKSGSTCTVTLPAPSTNTGRVLYFQNYQVRALVSASSNVVPLAGGAAATSILLASSGDSATLVSDGTNWLMTQYIPNNILLLE